MHSVETWSRTLDDVVESLLLEGDVHAPPVDAISLAERLGMLVAFDDRQTGRARFSRLAGRPSILLKPDDRPERLHWAAAHELGESVAWRVCCELGDDDIQDQPERRETIANHIASRLLLPTGWFAERSTGCGRDLFALKRDFATASHELIALRWLDFDPPAIVSVFDHGRLTRRRSNTQVRPPRLHSAEIACQRRTSDTGRECRLESDQCLVRGWPIHEPGWKREILLLEPLESDWD